jgi:putative heme-binding domain-containing protein
VGTIILDRVGAGYKSASPFNLVASQDEWAAPTMAEVGPDGNVWVIDWYNFIVQHNPTPQGFTTGKGNAYESELRDKKYGRIYRVVYQGDEGLDAAALAKADQSVKNGLNPSDEKALVEALQHPTMLWRKTAQRLLIERLKLKQETLAALQALVNQGPSDSDKLCVGSMHALWVLDGVGALSETTTSKALKHASPGVRRNALQVAKNGPATLAAIVDNQLLMDTDLQVRLAALLKVADIPDYQDALGAVLSQPDRIASVARGAEVRNDKWLLDAWTTAASRHASKVLTSMMNQKDLKLSPASLDRVSIVSEHVARSKLGASDFEQLISTVKNGEIASRIVGGLVEGWPKTHSLKVSEKAKTALLQSWLNSDLPIETKSQVLQLASVVKIEGLEAGIASIQKELTLVFSDAAKDDNSRIAAAVQSVVLQPESTQIVEEILNQISTQSSTELATGILRSLEGSRVKGLADLVVDHVRMFTPAVQKVAIRLLLNRPQSTLELLDAIESGKLTLNDLQLDQKQALRDHPNAEVKKKALEVMKSAGGVPNSDRQKVVEAWMPITHETGSVSNGKAMYQKHCALCHVHGEIGVNIGPNLTGMAVHPKEELLMNILDPSRSVEGNFRTYSIRTTDGIVLTGMLASESKTSLELINSQGKREVVLREDIEELIASQKSLMPEGFEGQMTKTEMTDLLEFLTSKGKYVPLPINSVATSITTKGMFFDEKNTIERLVFPDWSPKMFKEVPFLLIDPQGDSQPNAIMLYGPQGNFAPKMPKQVEITCRASAVAIHILGGVGGWSFPASRAGSVSMIVRLHFADGTTEDHNLINGEHFADYIQRVDVPKSEFAFDLDGRQIRYLSVRPTSKESLSKIELIKGPDGSAPVVMAITIQTVE